MTEATVHRNEERPRILCVDDDLAVSAAIARVLRDRFEVESVHSASAAMVRMATGAPFAVVVSDYQMPETDGVTFLGLVRDTSPDTTRVLLTGKGDLDTAMAAVNRGAVFRFLTKPCAPDVLREMVQVSIDHHRLITGERVLLEQTLHGSIKALTDLLALAQPAAFGRATRVRRDVREVARRMQVPDAWSIEIAAMLSQVGLVALPTDVLDRFFRGGDVTDAERENVQALLLTAEQLLVDIPRLEAVRLILRRCDAAIAGRGRTIDATSRAVIEPVPIGARILKIALDFDLLEMRGVPVRVALAKMEGQTETYDPTLLQVFSEIKDSARVRGATREMPLSQARVGMVFADEVRGDNGMLLVARGQEVTASLVQRIRLQWQSFATRYVVVMHVASESPAVA